MKPRTRARCIALQALYEIDVTGHPLEIVRQYRIEESSLDNILLEFARQIVFSIYPLRNKLDKLIAKHAPDWPLDQVATIDRNIIRIALWEFAVKDETPTKVAINEAVELAKLYGSDSSARFVNGVLGSLAARKNEIKQFIRSDLSGKHKDELNPI